MKKKISKYQKLNIKRLLRLAFKNKIKIDTDKVTVFIGEKEYFVQEKWPKATFDFINNNTFYFKKTKITDEEKNTEEE